MKQKYVLGVGLLGLVVSAGISWSAFAADVTGAFIGNWALATDNSSMLSGQYSHCPEQLRGQIENGGFLHIVDASTGTFEMTAINDEDMTFQTSPISQCKAYDESYNSSHASSTHQKDCTVISESELKHTVTEFDSYWLVANLYASKVVDVLVDSDTLTIYGKQKILPFGFVTDTCIYKRQQ